MMEVDSLSKRKRIEIVAAASIYSLLAAFMFVVGKAYDTQDIVDLFSASILRRVFITTIIIVALIVFAMYGYKFFKNKGLKIPFMERMKAPRKYTAIILPGICYLISLLSLIPGIFSYDCWQEWQMMVNGKITSHHPVLHVLLAGGLAKVSNDITGSGNLGVLIYVLLQMACLLWVIKRIFAYMNEQNTKPVYQWCALLFFSFSPIINLYSMVVSKDGLFAVFALLFLLETYKMVNNREYFKNWKNGSVFVVSALGTMIFRNNGLYVAILVILFMFMKLRGRRREMFVPMAVIFALYALYTGPLYKNLKGGVEDGSKREFLAIPIQQLARVYRFTPEDLSKEDLSIMYSVIKEDNWALYIPTCADAVKNGFIDEGYAEYSKDFLTVWLRQGIKHPMTYVNALMANTVDYWYPLAINDSYDWLYGMDPETSDFLDYRAAEPCNEVVVFQALHDMYNYIATDLEVTGKLIPALFLNPGFYILFWLTFMLYDICVGNNKRVVIYLTLFLYFATLLLGPMVQVRYIIIFYYAFPLGMICRGAVPVTKEPSLCNPIQGSS